MKIFKGAVMIFWLAGAFVFGLFIPYMARRFAKFMPTTFAGAIVELLRKEKKLSSYHKTKQYKKLAWRSLMTGLLTVGLTALILAEFTDAGLIIVFAWTLLLLAEIDVRMFVLPDILTVPLLLVGIAAAYVGESVVSIDESVYGALVGYFFPVLVSLLIVWYKKDAFGGGDIKLLAAQGAWLGVEGLLYVITIAAILGLVWAMIKKQKALAFGPMLAIAGIIVVLIEGY